jgi:hypothetical protein
MKLCLINWSKCLANAGFAAFTAIAGLGIAAGTSNPQASAWSFLIGFGVAFFLEWRQQEEGIDLSRMFATFLI